MDSLDITNLDHSYNNTLEYMAQTIEDRNLGHSYNNTLESAAYTLRIIGRPLISVVGICCNILALAVFSRKPLRWAPSCMILKGVALGDILVLICGFFYWTNYDLDIPSMTANEGVCKFVTISAEYFGPELTSSLLILLSTERLLKADYSDAHVVYFSVKRTAIAILSLALFFFFLNIPVLTTQIFLEHQNGSVSICWNLFHSTDSVLSAADRQYYSVYRYIVLVLYGGIPYIGLPILNGWLLWKMRVRHKLVSIDVQVTGRIPDPLHPMDTEEEVMVEARRGEEHMKEMTRLVISITVCYWILTIGFNLIQAGIYDIHAAATPQEKAVNSMMFTLFVLMFYMNHASNFFLYCLNCKAYRQEFKAMIRDVLMARRQHQDI